VQISKLPSKTISCWTEFTTAKQIEMPAKQTGMNVWQKHNCGDEHRCKKQAAQRKVTEKKQALTGLDSFWKIQCVKRINDYIISSILQSEETGTSTLRQSSARCTSQPITTPPSAKLQKPKT